MAHIVLKQNALMRYSKHQLRFSSSSNPLKKGINRILCILSFMQTTIKVEQDTRTELIRIKGELETKLGQTVNYDEVIRELIRHWKEKK